MSAFHYNIAFVCGIPESFADGMPPERRINLEVAREEHRQLINVLRKCEVRVIELDMEEDYPECCFVDDCAVVIGGTALITRPGQKTRQGEVGQMRKKLRDERFKVLEILDPDAIIEGGDVLFTGKEIFVGLGQGKRTNEKGASALASAFPEYNVTPVRIDGQVQLKSLVTMCGRDIIAVGSSKNAENVMKQIKDVAHYSYRILKLDSDYAANMLYINGRLVHRTREEIGERSYSDIQEILDGCTHFELEHKELAQAGGNLLNSCLLCIDTSELRNIISTLP